jgi:hypothetical protein
MQMSFAALFSHIVRLPRGSLLLLSFQFGTSREYPGWDGVATRYYFPLLESISEHAALKYGVTLQMLSPMTDPLYFSWKSGEALALSGANAKRAGNLGTISLMDDSDPYKGREMRHFNVSLAPWCFGSLVRRQCPKWSKRLPVDAQTGQTLSGHCGAFFADGGSVAAWRRFLVLRYDMWTSWYGQSVRRGVADHDDHDARPQRPLRVLILNRCPPERAASNFSLLGTVGGARGRHLTPETQEQIYRVVKSRCRLIASGCSLQVLTTGCTVEGFGNNCKLFGSFDLLVAVHGAALANLWCATPGASVIEVTLHHGDTMWVPLIRQMGLGYCSVSQPSVHTMPPCGVSCLGCGAASRHTCAAA